MRAYYTYIFMFCSHVESELWAKHRTTRKINPSNAATQRMRSLLENEYIFYKFVRQKFNKLIYGLRQKENLRRKSLANNRIRTKTWWDITYSTVSALFNECLILFYDFTLFFKYTCSEFHVMLRKELMLWFIMLGHSFSLPGKGSRGGEFAYRKWYFIAYKIFTGTMSLQSHIRNKCMAIIQRSSVIRTDVVISAKWV